MATVDDVASYILKNAGPMTAMKLQKLVYYSQAWHLVWDERPLWEERNPFDRIQAWANGPVVYSLYDKHRGQFHVSEWPSGNPDTLSDSEAGSVDAVLGYYGSMTAHQLSELTHSEDPWRNARKGLPEGARCERPIRNADMMEYYDGLTSTRVAPGF